MNKEDLANIYILYKSEIGPNRKVKATTDYHDQISTYFTYGNKVKLDVDKITRMAKVKWG